LPLLRERNIQNVWNVAGHIACDSSCPLRRFQNFIRLGDLISVWFRLSSECLTSRGRMQVSLERVPQVVAPVAL
jgi:hypothetical protein